MESDFLLFSAGDPTRPGGGAPGALTEREKNELRCRRRPWKLAKRRPRVRLRPGDSCSPQRDGLPVTAVKGINDSPYCGELSQQPNQGGGLLLLPVTVPAGTISPLDIELDPESVRRVLVEREKKAGIVSLQLFSIAFLSLSLVPLPQIQIN